jgi:ribonuclease J
VGHSAYDSYAILLEADGKRLFYTGDFRAHGRKASLTEKLIEDPPKNVNVLLMEGTCIGRDNDDLGFPTEDDLVPPLVEIFQQTKGMPLVWCSGQNIDRIVTIFKACRRSNRQLIVDMYTAEILRATGNKRIPQADWNGIRVFLPASQKWRIKKEKAFDVAKPYYAYRTYPEKLAEAASKSVLLFRPSMVSDLERANCLKDASLVCSKWAGYLKKENLQWFAEWLKQTGTPLHFCHTSGHASVFNLRRMRDAFPDAIAVPVHLENREQFSTFVRNVRLQDDGEWWNT